MGWDGSSQHLGRGAACLQFALAGREIEDSPLTLSGDGLGGKNGRER